MELLLALLLYLARWLGWNTEMPGRHAPPRPVVHAPRIELLQRGLELTRCLQSGRESCYVALRAPRPARSSSVHTLPRASLPATPRVSGR